MQVLVIQLRRFTEFARVARFTVPAWLEKAKCANCANCSFLVRFLPIICIIFYAAGCGPKYYLQQNADVGSLRKIAVMPIENFTADEYAGDKMRRILLTELLSRGVEVIEPGEITRLLKEMEVRSIASLMVEEIQEIGWATGASAVMMGSVEAYGVERGISVSYAEVTVDLRLIEVSSGNIVWSVRHSSGGPGFWTRHFGSEGMSLSETAGKVVREAIRTVF